MSKDRKLVASATMMILSCVVNAPRTVAQETLSHPRNVLQAPLLTATPVLMEAMADSYIQLGRAVVPYALFELTWSEMKKMGLLRGMRSFDVWETMRVICEPIVFNGEALDQSKVAEHPFSGSETLGEIEARLNALRIIAILLLKHAKEHSGQEQYFENLARMVCQETGGQAIETTITRISCVRWMQHGEVALGMPLILCHGT